MSYTCRVLNIFKTIPIEEFFLRTCKEKQVNNLEVNKMAYLFCVNDNINYNNHHRSHSHIL